MTAARAWPWTITADGLQIAVRATPKAARDSITGIAEDADGRLWLKVRLSAAPEDGKANQALIRLLARASGAPRSRIALVSGETARAKRVLIRGDGAALAARIAAALEIQGTDRQGTDRNDGETD